MKNINKSSIRPDFLVIKPQWYWLVIKKKENVNVLKINIYNK